MNLTNSRWWPAVAIAIAWSGCDEQRPWQGTADGGVVDESRPFLPRSRGTPAPGGSDGPLAGGGSPTDPDAQEPAALDAIEPTSPGRTGGLWKSCHAGFSSSDAPLLDVTRLGALCGPANGMHRVGNAIEGQIGESQPSAEHRFNARRGGCYRVIAAASREILGLGVTVLSSRGSRVAGADPGEARWAIVDVDRPFCSFSDDRLTLRVAALRGRGRYAAEVWELR